MKLEIGAAEKMDKMMWMWLEEGLEEREEEQVKPGTRKRQEIDGMDKGREIDHDA